jgi:hypothetical protein
MFIYKNNIEEIIYKEDGSINPSKVKESYFEKYYKYIYDDINKLIKKDYPFNQKILLYINKKTELDKCVNCNKNEVKYSGTFKNGFNKFCSKKCSNQYNSKDFVDNRIKKYGFYYNNKDKADKTRLEKYGDSNYNNRESAYKTMIDKYGAKTTGESEILTEKIKHTNIEKYGSEYSIQSETVRDKIKETVLEKYGVENIIESDIIKEKIKNTLINKYGTTNIFEIDGVLEKRINTNLNKYGVEHVFQSDIIKNKIIETNLTKYGVLYPSQSDEIRKKIKDKQDLKYIENYKKLGIDIEVLNDNEIKINNYCNIHDEFTINKSNLYLRNIRYNVNICTKCNPISNNTSSYENEIKKYLNNKNVNFIEKDRVLLNGQEVDILIPEFNIGIEFNGSYYHSDKFKDKNYHLNKTNTAILKEYNIFHIHECDFVNNKELIYSMINNKLNLIQNKIYARKCIIKKLKTKEEKEFLNENHIQGYAISLICYGLYYNNELVSVISFSKKRIISKNKNIKDNEYELLRFCNKKNTLVMGGASKLLRKFEEEFTPESIYSYANRDYSNGNLYSKLGFNLDSITEPSYFWEKNNIKYNRFSLRKSKLVEMGFDINKTEYQILTEQNYNKIYTTGNLKFIKKYEKYN